MATTKNNEGKKQFMCLIDTKLFEKIKSKGWKYQFIVEEGVNFLENRTDIRVDVEENRNNQEKLEKANRKMQSHIYELQRELEKIKNPKEVVE